MSDRELLELAANAAGMQLHHGMNEERKARNEDGLAVWRNGGWSLWNPLTDDGDALRLAVKCELNIHRGYYSVDVHQPPADNGEGGVEICEPYGKDEYAATRRAIVLAAAELGRQMP